MKQALILNLLAQGQPQHINGHYQPNPELQEQVWGG
jgi:hypothetical protein